MAGKLKKKKVRLRITLAPLAALIMSKNGPQKDCVCVCFIEDLCSLPVCITVKTPEFY